MSLIINVVKGSIQETLLLKEVAKLHLTVDQLNEATVKPGDRPAQKAKKFKRGQRVILPANEEEGWEREEGTITDVNSKDMYIVQLDDKYIWWKSPNDPEDRDDGIREVHADNIEAE